MAHATTTVASDGGGGVHGMGIHGIGIAGMIAMIEKTIPTLPSLGIPPAPSASLVALAERARAAKDTPEATLERFAKVMHSLFKVLVTANDNAADAGQPSVPTAMLAMVETAMHRFSATLWSKIVDIIAARGPALAADLKKRDIEPFAANAHILFEGVPTFAIDSIVNAVKPGGVVAPETVSDIFDHIDTLMRLAIKREALLLTGADRLGLIVAPADLDAALKLYFPADAR